MHPPPLNSSAHQSMIVVMGDVHHQFALAVEGLEAIEKALGRSVDQVFSVGDMGLFLQEEDWHFLTGPKKYRASETSPQLRQAWEDWRWPLAMIAGNHEPFHLLRDWNPATFHHKLTYTNAGWLAHSIPALCVAGLSGIFHPDHLHFPSPVIASKPRGLGPTSWSDMVKMVREGNASPKCLAYFKESEIQLLHKLTPTPHLLLLHDWPTLPDGIAQTYSRRPEREIVDALTPPFVCCGHHHRPADFQMGQSRILALNLIHHSNDYAHRISPGWAAIFGWDGAEMEFLGVWP